MSAPTILTDPSRRRAFGLLVRSEMKLERRYPLGAIVALGIPLLLLVIFGSIPSTSKPMQALGGISFFNLYVPTLLVFVLLALGVAFLPRQLATYRQQGVLRRMSTTPVPPSYLLAAQLTVSIVLSVVGVTILLGLGAAVFNMTLPRGIGGDLVVLTALVLAAAALLGLGLCAAALASSPAVMQAVMLVLFYPLAFFSGLYVPIQEIHSTVIREMAKVLPTGAAFNALHAAFTGGSLGAGPLLVLAGWAAGSSLLAARIFRWE
jgi:ABC-2 type transport system permease protein